MTVKMTRIDMLRRQLGIPHPAAKGTDMTVNTEVHVPTAHASRYLQQLCKHWSHNLTVDFDETHGTVTFPRDARGADWPGDTTLKLLAREGALDCRLEATSSGQLEALKGAVSRHLDRFAFREAPLAFDWKDAQ